MSLDTTAQRQALERTARDSRYLNAANAAMIRYCERIFRRYMRGRSVLEMGPAEGVMTERLVANGYRVTVVEGSQHFCEQIRARLPGVEVVHALFEEYQPAGVFDNILLGHVLEHVEEPVNILRRVRRWLAPDGRVLAAVPNARSLHRQAAVIMGLLQAEDALNEMDRHHGHRRVYNPESFRQDFIQAGFRIEVFGGYWLKPLSNAQIEAHWTPRLLEAFMQLGERYPDIAAEIYIIASAGNGSCH